MAVIIGLLAAAYAWIRVNPSASYFRGDILTQFLPFYTAVADRVRDWQLPGWNPAIFSGTPMAGDPTSTWGYLPALIPFLLFSPIAAYKAYVLFHFLLVSTSTYFFGRSLEMGPIGSAVAALAMMLGPFNQYSQCCTVRMNLTAWLPLGLLAIELALRSTRLWQRTLCWAVGGFVISQIIAGYFGKGLYLGVLFLSAYLAYRTLLERPRSAVSLGARFIELGISLAAMLGFGAGFAAMSLLPRLDFLQDSNLAGGSYSGVSGNGGVEPPNWKLGRAISDVLDPSRPTYYIGVATIALAVAGVFLAGRRFAAPFFGIASAVVFALVLSPNPVHSVAYLLPRFKTLHEHDPQIILVMMTIGPAMLAGGAVSMLERRLATTRRLLIGAGGLLGSLLIAALLVRHDGYSFARMVYKDTIGIALILAMVAALAWAPWAAVRRARDVAWLPALSLLLILFLNLDRGRLATTDTDRWQERPAGAAALSYAEPEYASGAAEFLRTKQAEIGPFRYFGYNSAFLSLDSGAMRDNYRSAWSEMLASDLILNNRAIPLGLQDIQGYDPVQESNYLSFINALNGQEQEYHETNVLPSGFESPLLRLLNVRYIIIPLEAQGPDFQGLTATYPEVFRDGSVRVLEIPDALPRAWTVHAATQMDDDDVLPMLQSGSVNPEDHALLTQTPPAMSALPTGSNDTVSVTKYQNEEIELQADMASDGMVLLSEVYDHGWSVTVDGKSGTLYEVDGLLRGVAVPAGKHSIELAYSTDRIRDGIALSVATMLFAAITTFLLWRLPSDGRGRFWPRVEALVIPGVQRTSLATSGAANGETPATG